MRFHGWVTSLIKKISNDHSNKSSNFMGVWTMKIFFIRFENYVTFPNHSLQKLRLSEFNPFFCRKTVEESCFDGSRKVKKFLIEKVLRISCEFFKGLLRLGNKIKFIWSFSFHNKFEWDVLLSFQKLWTIIFSFQLSIISNICMKAHFD